MRFDHLPTWSREHLEFCEAREVSRLNYTDRTRYLELVANKRGKEAAERLRIAAMEVGDA